MATSAITIAVNNPYATAGTASLTTGGGWANNNYCLMVVANYNSSGYDHDGMGWAAASKFNSVTVSGATNDAIVLPFTAADPIPISYDIYYRVGTTITLGTDVLTHAGSCAGSLSTVTLNSPDDAHTTTFAAAQTSFDLDPVVLVPGPRKNVTRAYNGLLSSLSYATEHMHESLTVNTQASSTPCSVANWRILQKIARGNIRVLITDGDTDADVLTWTCKLDPGAFVQSAFKGNGAISLPFIVESETYHA
jgi:hypothetical protein